jgi:hypothetical protein
VFGSYAFAFGRMSGLVVSPTIATVWLFLGISLKRGSGHWLVDRTSVSISSTLLWKRC